MKKLSWMKFAVGEGLTKTTSSVFGKLIGRIMGTLEMGCVAGIIIGFIQMIFGFSGSKKSLLVPNKRSIMWAIVFGFMASIFGTVWGFYTFTLGADIGIRTLLIMGSIIPGALIGRIFWRDSLGLPHISGIMIFLLAAWAMLDFPSLNMLWKLPIWVPAVLVITFTQPINEVLSRKASAELNHWVNNFWVGASTIFFCALALVVLAVFTDGLQLNITGIFVFGSVIIGALVVAMIAFKLLSYATGGTIALKNLVMGGILLITSAIAGIIIYHEPLTFGKVIGIILFFIAFSLIDNKTREILVDFMKKR